MTDKLIKNIKIPKYMHGIKRTKKSFHKKVNFIGCDTETIDGEPDTLQFCSNNFSKVIVKVNRKNVTEIFINILKDLYESTSTNMIMFHNLSFDLPVIFFPYHKRFKENEFTIVDLDKQFCAQIYCGKIWFAEIIFIKYTDNPKYSIEYLKEDGSQGLINNYMKLCSIQITDSNSFFSTDDFGRKSLKNLSYELNLKHKKLDVPKGLGESELNTDEFLKYALNDAVVQFDLGKYILNMHKEYNIPASISIAQMAQYVFTKNFMDNDFISMPFEKIIKASEFSYHGGKNGFYLPGPCEIPGVYDVDVNSMYPYAMIMLPPMTKGYYDKVYDIDYNYEGIYNISGYVHDCKYPILCDHEFKYLSGQYVKNLWVTSYELKEAQRNNEIDLQSIFGYIWVPEENSRNPFKEYVMHFYEKKNTTPKTDSRYMMYKLLLNCFSGDTEVLTYDGIKNIKDIKIGDKVYSINPTTLETEIRAVEKTYEYPYSGKMIRLNTKRVDFLVTPNHKFLLQKRSSTKLFDFIEAGNLQNYDAWVFPTIKPLKGECPEYINLWSYLEEDDIIIKIKDNNEEYVKKSEILNPEIYEIENNCKLFVKNSLKHNSYIMNYKYKTSDFLNLMGWFISEGSYQKTNDNSFCIVLHQSSEVNSENFNSIVKLLNNMNIICRFDNSQIRFSSKLIYNYLRKNSGNNSFDKHIPENLFNLDYSLLQNLFESLMLGDGNGYMLKDGEFVLNDKDQMRRYSTVSKQLRDDFLRLCFILGIKTRYDRDEFDVKTYDKTFPNAGYCYRIYLYKENSPSHIFRKKKDISEEIFNDKVYCITVKDNHTIYAGRNGKFEFSGQSLYGKFIQNVPHGSTKTFMVMPDGIEEEMPEFRAGGLYNPFIGSLITGFARAYLHRLEHKFKALDSATDAVKTVINPGEYWTKELGGISVKNYGMCRFLRNKLYIHFGENYFDPTKNEDIKAHNTFALHGFQGKFDDIMRIWQTKDTHYKTRRMVKIRESLIQNIKPLVFRNVDRELNVDLNNIFKIDEDFSLDREMDISVPMQDIPALKS